MSFADLGLSDELLRAVNESGYSDPTPIQQQAIPSVLMMRDIVGIAQTGTGKTAAFVLPMIDILGEGRSRARMPRSLILEPTRELAAQVAENFDKYGKYHKLSMALLIGGVQMGDQVKALEKGVDVLIATPGRLMDLFGRGKIMLNGCNLLVIDEADRMLDMGFIPDIEEICTKLPKQRQTLLFSATMPPPIKKLADKFLTNPKRIEVSRPASANLNITQYLVPVDSQRAKQAKIRTLLGQDGVDSAIIFCNRKTMVRDLNKLLRQAGFRSGEIHGDMEQSQRIAELDRFKAGEINILVASDVAARGLDVKGVSHVINYDAPWHPDDYVHRIGRTGRAGATGVAYTLVAPDDAENIQNIEKLTNTKIERLGELPSPAAAVVEEASQERPARGRGRGQRSTPRVEAVAAPAVPSEEAGLAAQSGEADAALEEHQPREERAPRAEREPRGERQPRADREPREARPAREERQPREDRAAREPRAERAPRPEREARPPREAREARPQRNSQPAPVRDDGPDDGWNGPMPSFLLAKIG